MFAVHCFVHCEPKMEWLDLEFYNWFYNPVLELARSSSNKQKKIEIFLAED